MISGTLEFYTAISDEDSWFSCVLSMFPFNSLICCWWFQFKRHLNTFVRVSPSKTFISFLPPKKIESNQIFYIFPMILNGDCSLLIWGPELQLHWYYCVFTPHHTKPHHTTTHHNTPQHNAQHHTTPHHNTTQHNTTHNTTPQYNTTHNTTQHTTHRNTPHHNTTHNTPQHNTPQHNTIYLC